MVVYVQETLKEQSFSTEGGHQGKDNCFETSNCQARDKGESFLCTSLDFEYFPVCLCIYTLRMYLVASQSVIILLVSRLGTC